LIREKTTEVSTTRCARSAVEKALSGSTPGFDKKSGIHRSRNLVSLRKSLEKVLPGSQEPLREAKEAEEG
jgi:hypothetical protein